MTVGKLKLPQRANDVKRKRRSPRFGLTWGRGRGEALARGAQRIARLPTPRNFRIAREPLLVNSSPHGFLRGEESGAAGSKNIIADLVETFKRAIDK